MIKDLRLLLLCWAKARASRAGHLRSLIELLLLLPLLEMVRWIYIYFVYWNLYVRWWGGIIECGWAFSDIQGGEILITKRMLYTSMLRVTLGPTSCREGRDERAESRLECLLGPRGRPRFERLSGLASLCKGVACLKVWLPVRVRRVRAVSSRQGLLSS